MSKFEKFIFEEYEKLKVAVGVVFAGIPVSPNFWTALSMLCALIGFTALAHANLQVGLLSFVLSAIFDVIDGGVASVRKGETPLGAWLDDVSDAVRELLLLLGLFIAPIIWVCPYATKELSIALLITLAMFVDFVKMHGEHRKILKEGETKEFARTERVERFGVVLIGLAFYNFERRALTYSIFVALLLSAFRFAQTMYIVFSKEREKFARVRKIREVI